MPFHFQSEIGCRKESGVEQKRETIAEWLISGITTHHNIQFDPVVLTDREDPIASRGHDIPLCNIREI